MDAPSTTGAPAAGTLRRLGALAYDALLLLALLFVATLPWLLLTGGEAVTPRGFGWVARLYGAWLLLVAFGYFGLSWTRGGQTLGMRAWRIGLEHADGGAPGWLDALVRFTLATAMALLAGFGAWYLRNPGWSLPDFAAALLLLPPFANLLWGAFDARGRSLLDVASDTRVVQR